MPVGTGRDVIRRKGYLVGHLKKTLSPLQERFIALGLADLKDLEILELILSQIHSQRQAKKYARALLKHFGSLRELLVATDQELQDTGLCSKCILGIKIIHELPTRILEQKIKEIPVYRSSKEIFDYLHYSMRDLNREIFRAIYLNSRHQIIGTDDLFEGNLNSVPVSPREIVESAIKHGTAALIFVHNHTSGDPTPSRTDKQLTRELVFISKVIQINVLDHIIIGGNRYFSFADEGLIHKYEDAFLNMRVRGFNDSEDRVLSGESLGLY